MEDQSEFLDRISAGLSLLLDSEVSLETTSRLISALCGLGQSEGATQIREKQAFVASFFGQSVVSQIQAWDSIVAARTLPSSTPVDLGL